MGSRNTKLKRGCRNDTPPGRQSWKEAVSMAKGYLRHCRSFLEDEEIAAIQAELVSEDYNRPNSIEKRKKFLENLVELHSSVVENLSNELKRLPQLESEKQY